MAKGLNLEQLLTGDCNKLRYIVRFGTALTLHKENVAEHSYYVALYSLFIARWAMENGYKVDIERVLTASLLHDLEESRTGDFPRPFKYRRPGLKHLLDEAARDEFEHIVTGVLPDNQIANETLGQIWITARDCDLMEGCIVALADFLSVISHLWQEVNCSNASMLEHYVTVKEYLDEFEASHFNFLRPIIEETRALTLGIFDKYQEGQVEVR